MSLINFHSNSTKKKRNLLKTTTIKALKSITFIILICTTINLNAQGTREVTHKAWVTLVNNSQVKGILQSASKEGIVLAGENTYDTINPNKINTIKIRRKGKIGRGGISWGCKWRRIGSLDWFFRWR